MRIAAWLTTAAGVALVALSILPVIDAEGLRVVGRGIGLLLMGLGGGLSALRGGPLREAQSERRRVAARLADPTEH